MSTDVVAVIDRDQEVGALKGVGAAGLTHQQFGVGHQLGRANSHYGQKCEGHCQFLKHKVLLKSMLSRNNAAWRARLRGRYGAVLVITAKMMPQAGIG